MVKVILVSLLIVSSIYADMLSSKIKSFTGANRYYRNQKIINIILGDKKQYIQDNHIDVIKLIKVLKNNGFVNLDLKTPQEVTITFKVKKDALLFLKIINSSLNDMGYNFYMTKEAIKNSDGFVYSIVMNTEYLIDPVYLSNELEQRGCSVLDIDKSSDTDWTYTISMKNAKVISKNILCDAAYKLKKPIKPYWINIPLDAKEISLQSYSLNKWHPYVVFFDKDLQILSIYEKNQIAKSFKMQIPQNTKYIMIDDKYTLSNIRLGLKLYINSQ